MVMMHEKFIGHRWHFGEIASKNIVRPLFLLFSFFSLVRILGNGIGVQYFGIFGWSGPSTLGHAPCPVMSVLSSLMLGGWLTHGDLALEVGVDFLAVAEYRLIPARVRGQWSRLRKKDLASIWAPASQASSHVGNGGVGVVRMRGALLALPTFATAQFKSFLDCGRAVRCLLLVFKVLMLMLSSLL